MNGKSNTIFISFEYQTIHFIICELWFDDFKY
jgi:hypothetical protein